jgi:hypothetical protein
MYVCEATDSNLFAQRRDALKQSADFLTAMRKYQSYYRNYSARWDYYICEDNGCALSSRRSYDQRHTLRPFAIHMTQTPIGSRKHFCPQTTTLWRGATIGVKLISPPCRHGECSFRTGCSATAKGAVPLESAARNSYSTLTGAISTTLCMRVGSSSKKKYLRGLCSKCVLTSLGPLCQQHCNQHMTTGAMALRTDNDRTTMAL